jgi:KDO2-lipid IV(A) lauroyltransferase
MSGNKIIEIGFSLKEVYRKTKENEIVCFLVDQSAHPDYSSYVNLFGMNVTAFSGPAKLALRLKPQLIIAYGIRQKNYKYKIFFERLSYDEFENDSDDNITALTQKIQSRFEEIIIKNPGQWLWLHKRFKHLK